MAPELRELRRDPWQEEQSLKKRRSRDRKLLCRANRVGGDLYAFEVQARIERRSERIRECREEQRAEIEGEDYVPPVRRPSLLSRVYEGVSSL